MVVEVTEATIVEGDYGSYLQFILYDSEDNLYDLSSANSVNIHLKRYGDNTLTIDGTCSIYDTDGTVRYTILSTDFTKAGDYVGDIEVHESGAITTWTPFWIHVIEELG